MYPLGAGALALVWLVGLCAIVIGVLLLALSIRVRAWGRDAGSKEAPSPSGPLRHLLQGDNHGNKN